MKKDKFYDYGLGEKVRVYWFDEIIEMEVIGHCEEKKLIQVGHLNAQGSFYITPDELIKTQAEFETEQLMENDLKNIAEKGVSNNNLN